MKKKVFIIAGVVVVAVAALLIIKPFGKKEAAVTFETVKVEKGNISNTVTATGTIEAVTSVDVGTQVSGIIDKVYVDFNQRVKQGQLLAQIDKKQLTAQLEQSRATLDQAQAQLDYQEATFNRLKALYEKKLIAQSDYDQAVYNYANAKSNLKNAQSSYDRNKVNMDYSTIFSPIDGVVLNRAVEEGQTVAASFNTPTLFTIVNDLTQMEVETSVDEADIGKVKKGQRVEFTVDAYTDMKFEGEVSEVRLQPVTTNNVVTYSVILSAPNPDEKLMPGMTASATIYVEEKENTLVLSGKAMRFTPDAEYLQKLMAERMKNMPDSIKSRMPAAGQMPQGGAMAASGNAAMPQTGTMPQGMPAMGAGFPGMGSDMKTVYTKDAEGNLRPAFVKVGIDNGSSVEILSGLKEGDEVVISMNTGAKKETTTTTSQGAPRGPFGF
jgi:HlyD family secretion protein